jgi:hypothetical protein
MVPKATVIMLTDGRTSCSYLVSVRRTASATSTALPAAPALPAVPATPPVEHAKLPVPEHVTFGFTEG